MKENQPASQSRKLIPQIIVLSHVNKFVPQNLIELVTVEVRNEFRGQQDVTPPPVTGGGGAQL